MTKHLIYFDGLLDIHAGGPSGYLANLKEGFDNIATSYKENIYWYTGERKDLIHNDTVAHMPKNKHFILKIKKYILDYVSKYKYFKNFMELHKNYKNLCVKDEVYDYLVEKEISTIHCNYILDLIKIKNILNKKNNKNIKLYLTTHCPESHAIEFGNLFKEMGYCKYVVKKVRTLWSEIEKYGYNCADGFIYPSEEALEPYFQTISNFKELIKNKDIKYFQTGVKALISNKSKQELREFYNIPDDKAIIVYIGRHNEVKGYDVLTRAAKKILGKRKDVVFLIGGKQSKNIHPPKNKNWKELGWVNSADLMRVADLFVLPNKRTFFDLILLEAMSMGTPVIASSTGGNKTVSKTTNSLILFDSSQKDLIKKINEFLELDKENKEMISNNILEAYSKNYTPEHFAMIYIDLINDINKNIT